MSNDSINYCYKAFDTCIELSKLMKDLNIIHVKIMIKDISN